MTTAPDINTGETIVLSKPEGYDRLPPIMTLAELAKRPPKLSPVLIDGILRKGNKMIINGDSKSGKTCFAEGLAVSIASGLKWLNRFQCKQGKVLYLNFEVQGSSMYHRFMKIYDRLDIKPSENLELWNLRGHSCPLSNLSDQIIYKCRFGGYAAIILDPIYKIQGGDENSASDIAKFCNELDRISHETGASVIYTHHHAKGSSGDRKAIDRGSGSGVFARDPDAILDLSILALDKNTQELASERISRGDIPLKLEFNLREFATPETTNLWFSYPAHEVDDKGILDQAVIEGSKESNLLKSPNRTSAKNRYSILVNSFSACAENGVARLSEMADWSGISDKSLRRYIAEYEDEFSVEKGLVWLVGTK